MKSRVLIVIAILNIASFKVQVNAQVQEAVVDSFKKISNFSPDLHNQDGFGNTAASLGDLNGDGTIEVAVGANAGNTSDPGAVWILSIKADGMLDRYVKITNSRGGLPDTLDAVDRFGTSVANIGDLDDDGIIDLAVTAWQDDDGGTDRGAVWILFLNTTGTVKSFKKISDTEGGFEGDLDDGDAFGREVTGIGDFDKDGVNDIAVGAASDDDGGTDKGAVWLLFLNAEGTVKSHKKISSTEGGFMGDLDDGDLFGNVENIGDLDADGVIDLAVGAVWDDDGGTNHGAVWILFLNADGTVKTHQKISDTEGGFEGTLTDDNRFGGRLALLGEIEDGVTGLAVSSNNDNTGGLGRGAVWLLHLNSDGTVKEHDKVAYQTGGFTGHLDNHDRFGTALAALDLDCDGKLELAVGAIGDDDGGTGRGALWVLYMDYLSCTKSDVNFDGEINVLDVQLIVNIFLEKETPTPIEFCTADGNNDGIINVIDVQIAVNRFLFGKCWQPPTAMASLGKSGNAQGDTLKVVGGAGDPGTSDNPLSIYLANSVEVAGLSFDLVDTPDFLTTQTDTIIWTSRTTGFSYALNKNGRVIVFNLGGGRISPGRGDIMEILYEIAEEATKNIVSLIFENVVLSDSNAQAIPDVVLVDGDFPVSVEVANTGTPLEFSLMQNYPNPFNPETSIHYHLNKPEHVILKIYNTLGQEVITLVDERKPAGRFFTQWDGKDKNSRQVPSGLYLYRIQAGNFVNTKKMLLIR